MADVLRDYKKEKIDYNLKLTARISFRIWKTRSNAAILLFFFLLCWNLIASSQTMVRDPQVHFWWNCKLCWPPERSCCGWVVLEDYSKMTITKLWEITNEKGLKFKNLSRFYILHQKPWRSGEKQRNNDNEPYSFRVKAWNYLPIEKDCCLCWYSW